MSVPRQAAAIDHPSREVYTVSRLNLDARALLEETFSTVWIEGEISNFARPRSGHIYFSLKDEHCQVRCAMFRMYNRTLAFEPENGLHVLASAKVSLYPERGEFQLIVQYMEVAGAGALRRAFDALKNRLHAEGLFDPAHKRPIPTLPRHVGIITSPTGAAVRDVLSVLGRRFPAVPVMLYPVAVQGAGAAEEIARMIDRACERTECDVLILRSRRRVARRPLRRSTRMVVARAMHRAPIPYRHRDRARGRLHHRRSRRGPAGADPPRRRRNPSYPTRASGRRATARSKPASLPRRGAGWRLAATASGCWRSSSCIRGGGCSTTRNDSTQ